MWRVPCHACFPSPIHLLAGLVVGVQWRRTIFQEEQDRLHRIGFHILQRIKARMQADAFDEWVEFCRESLKVRARSGWMR